MPNATDEQMQVYADQRLRVRAEAFRALYNATLDDIEAIGDIYARASQQLGLG